ncbi:MAG: DHHA1 domain-containing protein [Patescibacteria group bacterium]|nr:DHHA1 domain-containing protein [Patescibacteria group bacterium]
MKKITVIYHNDLDGFVAALAAWKKFKNKAGYFGAMYGSNGNSFIPDKIKDNDVYILDFCYAKKEMESIMASAKKMVVIDHHISRKEEVKISTDYVYSEKNSGAVLAWKYFYPQNPVPKLAQYVEDMDLWNWKMPNSKEISASFDTYDLEFKIWNKIMDDFENPEKMKKYIEEGKAVLKYKDKMVKKIFENAEEVIFKGEKAYTVNSPILESEIGNFINKNKKILGIIWHYKKGKIKFSLRSGGKTDVSKLAEKFNGGGHKAASGFILDSDIKFLWKKK